ncbi:glycosyltransferase involved in cell wall biosynthesis [Pseudochelatococcus lubricantis]|uniref:Glycosyltransferase involved in cell wall biosynthesis n=1 Tax=Pseudochelatococcus lubricantis TaxID=1538102 RepID=A0ABX0V2C8_9HYPH|nr:glycosyltransferase family 4 protein [Pseudochelatococcus lubricantis]NIJ57970.1 glycosyltransferase involved in cell wall biosynthesis [Pseudochelatococcus lubricantis]
MKPKVAIVAAGSGSGETGGAERFFVGLRDALQALDLDVTLLYTPSNESDFDAVKESYLRFYDLDLSAYDGVITSKAPSYLVRHPNHVCYLQHTMRVFYDMFEVEFGKGSEELFEQRALIHTLDTAALRAPRTRKIFAIGEEVAQRLRQFNGLDAEVIRHPTSLSGFREGPFRHLFMPGRLHRWKRVDLAIDAMRHVKAPVELIISGTGEDAERFKERAAGDPRIRFTGWVSDEDLIGYYRDSLAVLFMPRNEDLGLITYEAFLSGKPVLTCADSGEPSRVVEDGVTGFVTEADPAAIAARIDQLAANPALAGTMGQKGKQVAAEVTWEKVAVALATALGLPFRRPSGDAPETDGSGADARPSAASA